MVFSKLKYSHGAQSMPGFTKMSIILNWNKYVKYTYQLALRMKHWKPFENKDHTLKTIYSDFPLLYAKTFIT